MGGLPCSLTSPGSSGNGARGERELEVRGQTLCSPGPSLGIAAGWPSPSRPAAVRCHLLAAPSPFHALRPEGGGSTQHSSQPGSAALVLAGPFPQPTPHFGLDGTSPRYHNVRALFLALTVDRTGLLRFSKDFPKDSQSLADWEGPRPHSLHRRDKLRPLGVK